MTEPVGRGDHDRPMDHPDRRPHRVMCPDWPDESQRSANRDAGKPETPARRDRTGFGHGLPQHDVAALNASAQFIRLWPSLLVIAGLGGSFYFLKLALRTLPFASTYALASGLGIAVVALAGIVLFGQKPDLAAMLGLGLILAGIVVINAFSGVAVH